VRALYSYQPHEDLPLGEARRPALPLAEPQERSAEVQPGLGPIERHPRAGIFLQCVRGTRKAGAKVGSRGSQVSRAAATYSFMRSAETSAQHSDLFLKTSVEGAEGGGWPQRFHKLRDETPTARRYDLGLLQSDEGRRSSICARKPRGHRAWGLGTQIGEPNGGKSVRGGDHFVPRLRVRWRKLSAVM
jgi:hypothetical protein